MEYGVLGRLEVRRDGEPVDLGAHRQRTLLAILLTKPDAVIAVDEIIEALWGEDGDGDKQNALWVYISGLRKAIEPEREKRTDGTVLLTRAPGYLVATTGDDVIDSVRFEQLVAEGRSLAETDPAAASLVLGEALAMWRGKPYEEFTYDSFFQDEIARLEALRIEAVEARIDADLKRGMSRELVSELEGLVRENPLRERLTGQLMLALYRSGRQAESLRAYGALRTRLGEELGIEPSTSIQRLEEQIVTADAGLETVAGAALAGSEVQPGLAVRGYELREQIGEGAFGIAYRAYQPAVGREVAIKVIRPEYADDPAFIRRFEAEAQLVARLEHPHIVPLYDYWREPGAAYLVMRLMRGGSLDHVLESTALTPSHALQVAEQMAGALQTAHEHDVVHRDIKPSNILIDDDGNAYLSDFGIAVGPDGGPSSAPSISGTLAAPYASPEQLANGEVSPASDVYSLAVVLAQALTGLRGDVPQIRGALDSALVDVLDKATDVVLAHRYQDASAFADDFRRSLGRAEKVESEARPRVEVENPYKGLRAFDSSDAKEFFGRERLVDRLVSSLGEPGVKGRFVALVGPSGSGKSSVIKAGLVPAIVDGALPTSERWFVAQMLPAPHPFEELESALLSIAVNSPALLLERLTADDAGLRSVMDQILPDDDSQLVLLIDQFEELFTQVDVDVADRFIDLLVAAVKAPKSRLRIVVTLRADFYDRPLRHRALGELLRDGTEVISPMTHDELERAISGPAQQCGVLFEPSLVARLIADVSDRPSVLPLLQYSLTELFDARTTSRITATAYDEIGGVSGALVKRAEGLLAGMSVSAQEAARLVFLRLVTLGEGSEDTRRRILLSELESLPVAPTDLRLVLDTFGRHRLLSLDRDPVSRGPSVEIAHETMLTEWTRLRRWIESSRDDLRNQRRLTEALGEWAASGQNDDYLLRGGRLEQLHGWASSTSLPLSVPEQSFLDASVAERGRVEEGEREREQRAIDAELRASHRARQLIGSGVLGVLVAALAVFGFVQWQSAEDGRSSAEAAKTDAEAAKTDAEIARAATEEAKADSDHLILAAELVTASEAVLDEDPELALLLAGEAVRETASLGYATEDAVDSLHWALQRLGVQYPVGSEAAFAVRSGPTGLAGVFVLPPADLVALAETSTERRLTNGECQATIGRDCPDSPEIPSDTPLRFGTENYGVVIPEVLAESPNFGAGPLAGTRVSFAASSALASADGLEAELDRFTQETGIEITIVPNEDFQATTAMTAGTVANFPDVASSYYLPEPWAQSRVLDLGRFLDTDVLRSDFGEYLVELSTRDADGASELQVIPAFGVAKDLVFYAKPAFEEAGYEIPETWDELVALSTRMVTDGRTPFCFQWEAGFASGFPGSDFFEAMLVRVGGVEVYDDLTSGDLSFASPEVVAAATRGEDLLFGPGFVRGGAESISSEFWGSPMGNLLETNSFTGESGPQCMMVVHQGQMVEFLGADTEFGSAGLLGVDVDVFALPQVDASRPAVVSGGGGLTAGLADRPEVRALLRFIASPSWGEVWAETDANDAFFSLNQRFDTSAYEGQREQSDFNVRQRIHEISRAAIEAGTWRYDLSDQMPAGFGVWTEDFKPGTIWQGMLDWVDQKKPIEEILIDIEAQRMALGVDAG